MAKRNDMAIAVAVFAGSLGLLAGGGEGLPVAGVLLTALASLPLVAHDRAPLAVFVFTALASTSVHLVVDPAGPPLGPTLAFYWVAAADARPRTAIVLPLAGVLLAGHLAAAVGIGAHPEMLFGIVLWSGVWIAGDRARLRRERMAELEDRARLAERDAERDRRLAVAEERARIARDLHDSAGHAINVILVHAGLGRLRSDDPEAAREAFATIESVARETVGEIDQLVRVLREDAGEVEPPPGLAAVDGLVERHRAAGLEATAAVRGARRALPPAVDRGVYRILQEALTNAARHGGGSARVELAFEGGALELTVANPLRAGRAARNGGGHGLVGMRERALLLGGSLDAGERDGRFLVRARLPLVE